MSSVHREEGWAGSGLARSPLGSLRVAAFCIQETLLSHRGERGNRIALGLAGQSGDGSLQQRMWPISPMPWESALAAKEEDSQLVTLSKALPSLGCSCLSLKAVLGSGAQSLLLGVHSQLHQEGAAWPGARYLVSRSPMSSFEKRDGAGSRTDTETALRIGPETFLFGGTPDTTGFCEVCGSSSLHCEHHLDQT